MDEQQNGQPEQDQDQAPRPPRLRPHLTVARSIIYRGDAETVEQILRNSLPDGIYLTETATATIEVRSAEAEAVQPERVQTTKAAILARAKAEHEAALSEARKPRILNPHTLRPVN